MRAFAVLVVTAHHAYVPFFGGGVLGVDIFFVLSGFLITNILLEEWRSDCDIRLGRVYARRVLRLFPALVAFLVFIQLYNLAFFRGGRFWDTEKAIIAVLCYCANWMRAFGLLNMGNLSHAWSLSIEEQFYLLFPFLFLMLLRADGRKRWLFAGLVVAIVLLEFHRAHLWRGPLSEERIYNGSDTRCDELLMGCSAAVGLDIGIFAVPKVRTLLRYALVPAILVLGILVAHPLRAELLCKFGWPAIDVSAASIILWLVLTAHSPLHRILELPAVVWIGRVSYGLYLWHAPIIGRVGSWSGTLGPFTVPVGFGLTFGVAAISYYCLEARFLKMKKRFSAA